MSEAKKTVFGGVRLMCLHKAGAGMPAENVLVRQLPLRLIPQLLEVLSDEAKTIALYADRPVEWSDTLSEESIEAILTEGENLNFPAVTKWLARRDARFVKLSGNTPDATSSPETSGNLGG